MFLFNKKIKKVLIIGANKRAKAVIDVINNKKALRMEVIGVVKSAEAEKIIAKRSSNIYKYNLNTNDTKLLDLNSEEEKEFNTENIEVFNNGKELLGIIFHTKADAVIFTYKSYLSGTLPANVKHYYMPDFYELATGKYYIDDETLADLSYWFISHKAETYEAWKRKLDILFSLIILIATFPIIGLIATGIKLTDGKSPFYSQDKIGMGERIFKGYKIRTTYYNDEEKQCEEERVIPWCKFVRKVHLDELPQMINVLKGDMSIVGPCCERKELAAVYAHKIKGYEYRTLVDTACTGWAQINQGYYITSAEESVRLQYDLFYIKHRNIFLDIAIFIKAIFLVCSGRYR